MFSGKKFTIILSLLLFSCGTKVEDEIKSLETNSDLLSRTDSLLSIVDVEFEHIIHEAEIKDEEFHRLEDRVREYENVITLDKREQANLLLELEQMKNKIEKKDSVLNKLNKTIETNLITINNLENDLYVLKTKIKGQASQYESTIYRLENKIKLQEEKISSLESSPSPSRGRKPKNKKNDKPFKD